MTAHSDHVEAVLQARLDTKRVEHTLIGLSGRCQSLTHSVLQSVGDGSVSNIGGDNVNATDARGAVRQLARDVESMLATVDFLDTALERYLGNL